MKNNPNLPLVLAEPSENEIRNYAYHLYVQGNCAPGTIGITGSTPLLV